jgi:hypothetical protein
VSKTRPESPERGIATARPLVGGPKNDQTKGEHILRFSGLPSRPDRFCGNGAALAGNSDFLLTVKPFHLLIIFLLTVNQLIFVNFLLPC